MDIRYERKELVYKNGLRSEDDVKGFHMEGPGTATFPLGRMRLESTGREQDMQQSNLVFWCPEEFPDNIEISWDFTPVYEPGLAIMFFAAKGKDGEDVLSSNLVQRNGPYKQYHHGDINALHVSYFRRNPSMERFGQGANQFQLCNLRKSHGFHLVSQGMDGIPSVVNRSYEPYRISVVKAGPEVAFAINGIESFTWHDGGEEYGPVLGGGKIGFRQMVPLIAEYANLEVYRI
jgi:hypothetical protein